MNFTIEKFSRCYHVLTDRGSFSVQTEVSLIVCPSMSRLHVTVLNRCNSPHDAHLQEAQSLQIVVCQLYVHAAELHASELVGAVPSQNVSDRTAPLLVYTHVTDRERVPSPHGALHALQSPVSQEYIEVDGG